MTAPWPAVAQEAYGRLLDHLSTCGDCEDATGCAVAQELRRRYKELRHGPLRVCRHCDEPIIPSSSAVAVHHETGSSGPGWTVWAHPEHVDDVPLIDDDLLRILMRVWAAGS